MPFRRKKDLQGPKTPADRAEKRRRAFSLSTIDTAPITTQGVSAPPGTP